MCKGFKQVPVLQCSGEDSLIPESCCSTLLQSCHSCEASVSFLRCQEPQAVLQSVAGVSALKLSVWILSTKLQSGAPQIHIDLPSYATLPPYHLRLVTFVRAAVASFFSASSCAATSFWYLAGTLPRPVFMFTVTTSPSAQVTTIDSAAAAPLLPPGHVVHQVRAAGNLKKLSQKMPEQPRVSAHKVAQLKSAEMQQTAGP